MAKDLELMTLEELEDYFNAPALPVIGDGKTKLTEQTALVEYDPDEAKYNEKYGLDAQGNPQAVDVIWEKRGDDAGLHAALEDGFGDMYGDGDVDNWDDGHGADPFDTNGFNDTW